VGGNYILRYLAAAAECSHSCSFDQRRRPKTLRTAMATDFFWPTRTTSRLHTIARATELLRTNPGAYWRDAELQEAQYEALERQEAAPSPVPSDDEIERPDRPTRRYWRSPELQQQHRDAIAGAIREAPAAQPGAAPADPGQAPGPADGAVRI
jgi:hypothetical protein